MKEIISYEFATTKLKEDGTTVGQVKDFLLEVMDYADNRPAKSNPCITREQAWNIFMGSVMDKPDEDYASSIICHNINKEFAV